MNWPTREYANRTDPLEVCQRAKMRYMKAAYILAGGDCAKVRQAIEQADDANLRDLRAGEGGAK